MRKNICLERERERDGGRERREGRRKDTNLWKLHPTEREKESRWVKRKGGGGRGKGEEGG